MGLTLDALHKLQTVERELVRLRNEKTDKEHAITTAQRLHKQLDDQIAAKKAECQQFQLKAQRLESEIRQREEQVSKLRQQLNITRTTREYAAILTEINTQKADTSKIEEQALTAMQAVYQSKVEVEQIVSQRDGIIQRGETAKVKLQEFLDRTNDSWKRLEVEKAAFATDIPQRILSQFERLAQYHDGDAMASVLKPHPKFDEYVCGGCHMSLRVEQVNALMTKDELQMCNNCQRILYLDANSQAAASGE